MSASSPDPNAAVTAAPTPSTPPVRSRPSRGLLAAVVVVVVIVVVVLALLLAGVLPGLSQSGGSSSSPASQSEQSAASTGGSFASTVSGGPWGLILASGVVSVDGEVANVSQIGLGNATCPLHGGTVTTLSVPGDNSTYYNGNAEAWLLYYYATAGGGAALLVFVSGGSAAEVGELSGSGCDFNGGLRALPSDLIDSTTAASAAIATARGAAYIAANPHANATYMLSEQSSLVGGQTENFSVWTIVFSGCATGHGTQFRASVFATNATVFLASNTTGETCSPGSESTPVGTAFAVGNPALSNCGSGDTYVANGCTAGDYVYTLTIETASCEFSDVLFEVKTAAGAVATALGSGGFTVVSVSGAIAAQTSASTLLVMTSSFSTYGASPICNGVACGPSTPFTSLYTITIDMGTANPAGQGYTFVAIGQNGYSGTTSDSLP